MAAHDTRDDKNNNNLIIHEAESTHKYHHKYPLEIHSTRKKNWNKRLTKHLGNLKKTLVKTSGYFTVASCPPMPRPRAHAPNKQGGKPAGQDTSSYTPFVAASPPDVTQLLHNTASYTGLEGRCLKFWENGKINYWIWGLLKIKIWSE